MPQLILEGIGVEGRAWHTRYRRIGQRHGYKRPEHLIRAGRGDLQCFAKTIARRERQPVIPRHDPGQPPGSKLFMYSKARGTERMAEASNVPVQPNSMRKRERSVRGELAPWLIESGRMPG